MKIEITFVVGGNPVVEINGEYLDMNSDPLSILKKEMIRRYKAMSWFKNIWGVTAWGGEIAPLTDHDAVQSLEQVVSFKDIVLHEMNGNSRDHEFLEKIRPILAILAWQKNKHFRMIGPTERMFQCLVCGTEQYGKSANAIIEGKACVSAPHYCALDECYSHHIWTMLDSDYKTGKEPRGRKLIVPLHK